MNLIIAENYEDMSHKAANYLIEKVKKHPKMNLGLATGGTPERTYELIIEDHQKNGTSYEGIQSFNLDEYIGLAQDHPNSYYYYMCHQLFNDIDIKKENVHLPSGVAKNLEEECQNYEALITNAGGVDLQILGIGSNGHIGFNEPGTPFQTKTHIVKLTNSTREANSRYFVTMADVPTQAITMGIGTIMKSKEILLLVSGDNKAEALQKLMREDVNEQFPASVLKNHPCVTIIADKKALTKVMVHS
ncbi:glucosamine-6-phosphate deaminase [Alkalihalobacillus sp. BA299]|uniref:glucosamine-6-phosphate deaminase n=1 Tax=Alkalihalobacillus sp. BA299 TaxID=2815938 RepID=UPI001ADB4092|nr:glucosamine-6-phosphate deaminase [Alkalihalobacillus sp. BA299]